MSVMARRVQKYGTTIFTEMTDLANRHGAINLGQGFPNFPAPDYLKQAVKAAIDADINQYPPAIGRPRLRQAIAAKLASRYGLEVDPDTQVVAMHGATECLFATMQGVINPGDEVIVFEPFYDSYVPDIEFAGGTVRLYTLRPPDWSIDADKLAALFTPQTRAIIVNSPHNPTGKVFDARELALIADLCVQHDVLCISDEVYEHIVFDDALHQPIATFPGMAERTVMISSIGKTFSVTGWKVGWIVAPPELARAAFRSHQWTTFAGAAPLEEASAAALEWGETSGYYADLRAMYQAKRDLLCAALEEAGLPVLTPRGTYFCMVDISGLGFVNDVAFCRYLTQEVGVAAIPPSAFYSNPADGATIARFAFCKTDEALNEAAVRLQRLRG